ncbi:hypothetical protein BGV12_15270, partial [Clostridioides difficile]
ILSRCARNVLRSYAAASIVLPMSATTTTLFFFLMIRRATKGKEMERKEASDVDKRQNIYSVKL